MGAAEPHGGHRGGRDRADGGGRPGGRAGGPDPANAALTVANTRLELSNQREVKANADLKAANERERARFALAQEAIRTFYTGVSEDLLLKQKEFDTLRTKLLRGAREFYQKLEGLLEGQKDRESRMALGRAYHDVGELTKPIGSREEALAIHRRGLGLFEGLRRESPDDPEPRYEVARSSYRDRRALLDRPARRAEATGGPRPRPNDPPVAGRGRFGRRPGQVRARRRRALLWGDVWQERIVLASNWEPTNGPGPSSRRWSRPTPRPSASGWSSHRSATPSASASPRRRPSRRGERSRSTGPASSAKRWSRPTRPTPSSPTSWRGPWATGRPVCPMTAGDPWSIAALERARKLLEAAGEANPTNLILQADLAWIDTLIGDRLADCRTEYRGAGGIRTGAGGAGTAVEGEPHDDPTRRAADPPPSHDRPAP